MLKKTCMYGCPVFLAILLAIPQVLDIFVPSEKGTFPASHWFKPFGFELEEIPDLTGKTIIITGANVGLGYWSAYHMAGKNAKIVMACRNMDKAEAAKQKILADYPSADLELLKLDLGDLQSVRDASEVINSNYKKIDSLMLNAGVMMNPYTLSKQGLQLQFAVNVLGHFYFTKLVLDKVIAAQPSTIVSLSSSAHAMAQLPFYMTAQDLNSEETYDPVQHYGQSKLGNILFAQELQDRLDEQNAKVYVNSVHPGAVMTDLQRHVIPDDYGFLNQIAQAVMGQLFWEPEVASLTQIFASVSPKIVSENIKRTFFCPIARDNLEGTIDLVRDSKLQKQLWIQLESYVSLFESGKPLTS